MHRDRGQKRFVGECFDGDTVQPTYKMRVDILQRACLFPVKPVQHSVCTQFGENEIAHHTVKVAALLHYDCRLFICILQQCQDTEVQIRICPVRIFEFGEFRPVPNRSERRLVIGRQLAYIRFCCKILQDVVLSAEMQSNFFLAALIEGKACPHKIGIARLHDLNIFQVYVKQARCPGNSQTDCSAHDDRILYGYLPRKTVQTDSIFSVFDIAVIDRSARRIDINGGSRPRKWSLVCSIIIVHRHADDGNVVHCSQQVYKKAIFMCIAAFRCRYRVSVSVQETAFCDVDTPGALDDVSRQAHRSVGNKLRFVRHIDRSADDLHDKPIHHGAAQYGFYADLSAAAERKLRLIVRNDGGRIAALVDKRFRFDGQFGQICPLCIRNADGVDRAETIKLRAFVVIKHLCRTLKFKISDDGRIVYKAELRPDKARGRQQQSVSVKLRIPFQDL